MAAVLEISENVVSPAPETHTVALRHATLAHVYHWQLVRSRYNVRRKRTALGQLKALIRSQGLLQNLVGYWQLADGKATGLIEIVAGERRMDSIGELLEEGQLPHDYDIPVLIVSEQEAIGISLAENMGREPMHPADVFDAMFALANAGRDADELALAFGTDTAAVRRWLRLARVAPMLLELYRRDEATYDQMAALAVSEDQEAQVRAWEGLPPHERSAWRLKNLLTQGEINVRTDRVARFVGVAALEQAGAVIRRDLFSAQDDGYLADPARLEELAVARLERLARRVRGEGHAWVAVVLRAEHAFIAGYGRAPLCDLTPDAAQQARLDAIDAEREALTMATNGNLTDKERARRERQLRMLRERRQAVERELVVPEAQYAGLSGALVTLDSEGHPVIHRHLIRPEDKPHAAPTKGAKGERPLHPERLIRQLTAHRTLALAATVAVQPHVALAVAVQSLWRGLSGGRKNAAGIVLSAYQCPEELRASPATAALTACEQRLDPASMPAGLPLPWLMAQTPDTLLTMLAFAVARSLDTVQGDESTHGAYEELAAAVQLDMRDWWQPTAKEYFSHLTKARLIEVVTANLSQHAAVPLEGVSKEVAAQMVERAFAESGWLPTLLCRPQLPVMTETVEDAKEDGALA